MAAGSDTWTPGDISTFVLGVMVIGASVVTIAALALFRTVSTAQGYWELFGPVTGAVIGYFFAKPQVVQQQQATARQARQSGGTIRSLLHAQRVYSAAMEEAESNPSLKASLERIIDRIGHEEIDQDAARS